MTVVKVSNKKAIENLQAKLMLRLGRKMSQQEILDLCIEVADAHFEDILARAGAIPVLTPEIAEEIIAEFEKFKDTVYDTEASFPSKEDEDIYSI